VAAEQPIDTIKKNERSESWANRGTARSFRAGVADLQQSVPQNLKFFRHQGAGLLSFAFEHGVVNRLTPGVATGGGRSSAMIRRMSWNNSLGTATSAIWKMT
jgi:hypothetical protein